jgi:predicted DNA-binding transcriptional regulator YafY
MLRLLGLLQTHRYWPGDDLAERLEVSPRTLRRDIDRLRELGYPVHASRGVGGGYQLGAGATMPPLLLDDDEAVAIAVGLRTAATGAIVGIEETSVQALTKLVQLLPPRLRRRVDALVSSTTPAPPVRGPTIDVEALTTLALACRDTQRARFRYVRRDGAPTERVVEPHRLVALGRRWYLLAFDLDRHDWRSFRLDRLSNAAASGTRFRPRALPDADAAAFVQASIAAQPVRYEVDVLVHAPAERVAREVAQWGTVEAVAAETCRLRMRVDDLTWPTAVLGAVDADFEVMQPPQLTDHLRRIGQRFTAPRPRATGLAVHTRP